MYAPILQYTTKEQRLKVGEKYGFYSHKGILKHIREQVKKINYELISELTQLAESNKALQERNTKLKGV
jgi:hypothetical protein